MDYKYKCKNHHSRLYKCMDWVENHDACKNCELRAIETIVFTVELESNKFKIVTDDSRGEWANVAGIEKDDLFSVQYYITRQLNDKGFKVVFEVV